MTRDEVLKTLNRATTRAFERACDMQDPFMPTDEEMFPPEERQHIADLLYRDYCMLCTVCAWVEKYVPVYEENMMYEEYMESKQPQPTTREDNVISLDAFRNREGG